MRLRFGDCVFDPATREVFRGGKPVHVSPRFRSALDQELLWPDTFVSDPTRRTCDFGLAKRERLAETSERRRQSTETRDREPRALMGTVGYTSPEQVSGLTATPFPSRRTGDSSRSSTGRVGATKRSVTLRGPGPTHQGGRAARD